MLRSNASYVITPDSFQISPAITGLPLARPSRRLAAMLLDLFFVVLLVELAGGVVLGLTAAYFAFRLASRVTGRPIPVQLGPRRAGDPARLVASCARAAAALGWRPQRPQLADIVESVWRWMRGREGKGNRG